jgi:hypothetical protein
MINILIFGFISIGIGVLFAIPGIILGCWLEKSNLAPNRCWLSLIFCVVLVLIKRIWFPDLSYFILGVLIILGSTVGVYRMDIYWSMVQKKR